MHTSQDIESLPNEAPVITAGLVIRRQRPRGKVVFITLEDEFGHIPLMVFPQVYESQEYKFKSPFLVVKGRLSRREGTHNVVVTQVKPFNVLDNLLQSKDWG
jgi:error-prone DNA polymerase